MPPNPTNTGLLKPQVALSSLHASLLSFADEYDVSYYSTRERVHRIMIRAFY